MRSLIPLLLLILPLSSVAQLNYEKLHRAGQERIYAESVLKPDGNLSLARERIQEAEYLSEYDSIFLQALEAYLLYGDFGMGRILQQTDSAYIWSIRYEVYESQGVLEKKLKTIQRALQAQLDDEDAVQEANDAIERNFQKAARQQSPAYLDSLLKSGSLSASDSVRYTLRHWTLLRNNEIANEVAVSKLYRRHPDEFNPLYLLDYLQHSPLPECRTAVPELIDRVVEEEALAGRQELCLRLRIFMIHEDDSINWDRRLDQFLPEFQELLDSSSAYEGEMLKAIANIALTKPHYAGQTSFGIDYSREFDLDEEWKAALETDWPQEFWRVAIYKEVDRMVKDGLLGLDEPLGNQLDTINQSPAEWQEGVGYIIYPELGNEDVGAMIKRSLDGFNPQQELPTWDLLLEHLEVNPLWERGNNIAGYGYPEIDSDTTFFRVISKLKKLGERYPAVGGLQEFKLYLIGTYPEFYDSEEALWKDMLYGIVDAIESDPKLSLRNLPYNWDGAMSDHIDKVGDDTRTQYSAMLDYLSKADRKDFLQSLEMRWQFNYQGNLLELKGYWLP